ncbi:MAG: YfcE family phosphodiesterase [bacterium]|nr:YfcE family phosphodiesterase [bacterium]
MKLGLFSDVHANAGSLDKALKLLERKGVDQLLCAGDLVDGMTEGEAAAQRVKNLNIPVVMGNHDFAYSRPQPKHQRGGIWLPHKQDDALSGNTVSFLASLPHWRELEYEHTKIVLAHANTWDFATYVFPSASSAAKVKRLKASVRDDVKAIILGHTHVPMQMIYKDLRIFNPGSVEGNRYSSTRSCAILTVPSLEYEVYEIDRGVPLHIETYQMQDW